MKNCIGPFCENFSFQLKKGKKKKKKKARSNDFGSDEYSYSILYSDPRVFEYSDTRSSPTNKRYLRRSTLFKVPINAAVSQALSPF